MSIKCKICNKEFEKLITSTHLKKHNITTKEYIDSYGQSSLSCEIYRQQKSLSLSGKNNPNYGKKHTHEAREKISKRQKGRTAPNKGKPMKEEQKQILRELALQRQPTRIGAVLTDEIKNKISNSIKAYAEINKEELSKRAYKALETKKNNGVDLAFFRGKTHNSNTLKKIQKITNPHISNEAYEFLNNKDIFCETIKTNTIKQIMEKYLLSETIIYRKIKIYDASYIRTREESQMEKTLEKWLVEMKINFRKNDRTQISPLELDFYLPDYKVAIELNGLFWHSEIFKDKNYHLNKTLVCEEKNIRLIHIFEDEMCNFESVSKTISTILKLNTDRVFARNTQIKTIENLEYEDFLNQHHHLKSTKSSIRLGLVQKNELIAVMGFIKDKERYNLVRYSTNGCVVVGGAGKLLKHFETVYAPESIKTFADRRWSNGNMYFKLGFEMVQVQAPINWYIVNGKRNHRFNHRKQKYSMKYDISKHTEKEIMQMENISQIWDCGLLKFVKTYQY